MNSAQRKKARRQKELLNRGREADIIRQAALANERRVVEASRERGELEIKLSQLETELEIRRSQLESELAGWKTRALMAEAEVSAAQDSALQANNECLKLTVDVANATRRSQLNQEALEENKVLRRRLQQRSGELDRARQMIRDLERLLKAHESRESVETELVSVERAGGET